MRRRSAAAVFRRIGSACPDRSLPTAVFTAVERSVAVHRPRLVEIDSPCLEQASPTRRPQGGSATARFGMRNRSPAVRAPRRPIKARLAPTLVSDRPQDRALARGLASSAARASVERPERTDCQADGRKLPGVDIEPLPAGCRRIRAGEGLGRQRLAICLAPRDGRRTTRWSSSARRDPARARERTSARSRQGKRPMSPIWSARRRG